MSKPQETKNHSSNPMADGYLGPAIATLEKAVKEMGLIKKEQQMTDTKKLTGREAVIALLERKKICRYGSFNNVQFHNTVSLDSEEWQIICIFNRDKSDIQTWQLSHVLQFNDWELVPEPRVWEGILEGRLGGMVYEGDSPYMPDWILGKKIKVRAEEIL